MEAIEFPEANEILAKDQPEYRPLPVHIDKQDPNVPMTACFELSDEEIEEIIRTRRIWNTQLTFGGHYRPVRLSVSNPFVQQG